MPLLEYPGPSRAETQASAVTRPGVIGRKTGADIRVVERSELAAVLATRRGQLPGALHRGCFARVERV